MVDRQTDENDTIIYLLILHFAVILYNFSNPYPEVDNNYTKYILKGLTNMYKNAIDDYLSSEVYSEIEMDPYFMQLISLLKEHLTEEIYLEVEGLLHLEISIKTEAGFRAGLKIGSNKL